ncbi:uncharacterized protein LOC129940710 [Eupeodes corollae]|uniref:uncharacterized protein LOC129940710 n=1 Tax=Eupeodes corollae TaxID=290404 RepID=UPI0024901AA9|nr:uncharacterized protein LOC129940710 [Eupeodes corollae]
MAKQWTLEETNQLIEKYESVEILWKTSDKSFRDRNKKSVVLTEFAKQFSCSEDEIKRKLHNLRNQMSQELKKSKKRKSGAGTDELYSSKWPYFRALQFLIPFLTPSETISNLNKETNCKNDVPTTVTTEITSESLKTVEIIKKSDPKGKQKKRRAESDDEDSLKAALKILKREPDEHDIFGEYVAQELRSLKFDFNKRKLKSEIRKAIVHIADDDDSLSQPSTSFQYSQTNDDSTSSVSGQLNFSNVNLSEGQSNKTSGEYITHVEFEKF